MTLKDKAKHLARAQRFLELMARDVDDMTFWKKLTASRQRCIAKRMKEEEITDCDKFWDQMEEIYLPFNRQKFHYWTDIQLHHLIRVPVGDNKDHFQAAVEGEYKDNEAAFFRSFVEKGRNAQEDVNRIIEEETNG